jgi:hypothetical protein
MARGPIDPQRTGTKRHATRVGMVVVAALLGVAGVAVAAVSNDVATVTQTADRIAHGGGDVVAVYDVEVIDRAVVEATFRAAEQTGSSAAAGMTASVGLVRLSRAGVTVHAAPAPFLIPLAVIGLPEAAVGGVMGSDVSAVSKADQVVINELTAQRMGAQVGDLLEMRAVNGAVVGFAVSGIRPYSQIGGSDVVMTTAAVNRLGLYDDTRMVVWNIASRPAIEGALAAEGLYTRANTRVAVSWDAPNPDDTLSTPRTHALIGEAWYRPLSGDNIEMHPTWLSTYLPTGRVLLNSSIPIRARCHNAVSADLTAALADVAAAGLGGQIDVTNTNTYGGCFGPRYARFSGFLSRHAYAMAIDINTVTNCQGCVPQMNCEVVRIFRRHGFAWGGNFRLSDGMHFEWVGERRDQIAYPSKYCPNLVNPINEAAAGQTTLGIDVLTTGINDQFS